MSNNRLPLAHRKLVGFEIYGAHWIFASDDFTPSYWLILQREGFSGDFDYPLDWHGVSKELDRLTWFLDRAEINAIYGRGTDQCIRLFFSSKSKGSCDLDDESDKPLFDRAKEALGPLNSDEMYAFVPALALGGSAELKNLKKVKIIEHLALLADLGEKRIMQNVNKILGASS